MTLNQAMTVGALGFAGFAVWFITRKNVNGSAAGQPGQVQRDAGLSLWSAQLNDQQMGIESSAWLQYTSALRGKLAS